MGIKEILLGLSLVANGYFLVTTLSEDEAIVVEVSGACDDSKRYPAPGKDGGGIAITEDQANAYIASWIQSNQPINYSYISKIALDSIFARDLEANGLRIYNCKSSDSTYSMIVTGITKETYRIRLDTDQNKLLFLSEDVCPSICD